MEELKKWSIDSDSNAKVTALDTAAQPESEELLEDILAKNPEMLADGLKLIGRRRGIGEIESPALPRPPFQSMLLTSYV